MTVNDKRLTWVAMFVAAVFMVAGLAGPGATASADDAPPYPVVIEYFWGDGCPHCANAKVFLDGLMARHPTVELRAHEVWHNRDNARLLVEMAAERGFEPTAVPTLMIGERYWVGYADHIGREIEAVVVECATQGCGPGHAATPGGLAAAEPNAASEALEIPFLGSFDLSGQSIWFTTALIAFVDGFNPCSLWVLSILIALALHAGSRARVLLIGTVFITVTAAVYALFIAGLFTVLTVVGVAQWVQVLVALVALFFGVVNIKDYFWFGEGVSFTIEEDRKAGIYRRARGILQAGDSTFGLVTATVLLAVAVSMVEFTCTAGFPVLWTNILTAQGVTTSTFVALLLLYLVIYQLDEMAIFLTAVVTLKAGRMEERHGRLLKLVGGMLMLTLALVMIVDPTLLNGVGTSLAIFGVAFALTAVVVLVHRVILPRFGIWIGSEEAPQQRGSD